MLRRLSLKLLTYSLIVAAVFIYILSPYKHGYDQSYSLKTMYNFTSSEITMLTEKERRAIPFRPSNHEHRIGTYPDSPSKKFVNRFDSHKYRYRAFNNTDLRFDTEFILLGSPKLSLTDTETLYPSAELVDANEIIRRFRENVNFYFEFDTTPTFDSPNIWRYPQLMPDSVSNANRAGYTKDLRSAQGASLDLHRASQRSNSATDGSITFPFRVTAMAYGLVAKGEGTIQNLAKKSALLTYGLEGDEAIKEVYNFVRQSYLWGGDTRTRTALDTYISGVSGCGHLADLVGTMLEMNGHRYRLVAGFYPKMRDATNGNGGHSAIEIFNSNTQAWSYLDTYLDIQLPNLSVSEFNAENVGNISIAKYKPRDSKLYGAVGESYSLNELFKFRLYADHAGRSPMVSMLSLKGREDEYGSYWPLRAVDVDLNLAADLPEKQTIWVRARYIVSNCPVTLIGESACTPKEIRVSKWAKKSFTINPQRLLKRVGS